MKILKIATDSKFRMSKTSEVHEFIARIQSCHIWNLNFHICENWKENAANETRSLSTVTA